VDDARFALIQMWSNDPYLMLELIRQVGMLQQKKFDVQIFLIEDGADMGFPNGIRKACMDDGVADNIIQGVDAMLDAGVTVLICNKCYKDRSLDDSYGAPFHGISPDSFYQYVEDAIQADLNLTFQGMTQQHLENIIDRRIQASLR
jgi:sulfur relay (sulfurtransferase) complex TusBCD TusD component (DsrE family)